MVRFEEQPPAFAAGAPDESRAPGPVFAGEGVVRLVLDEGVELIAVAYGELVDRDVAEVHVGHEPVCTGFPVDA